MFVALFTIHVILSQFRTHYYITTKPRLQKTWKKWNLRMKYLVLTLGALLSVSACESKTPSSPNPSSSGINVSVSGDFVFLPYGQPAPDVLPPNTIPQPYNPEIHGPPRPNSTPFLNLPPKDRTRRSASASSHNDGDTRSGLVPAFGSTIKKALQWSDPAYKGYFSNNQLATDLTVPQGAGNVIFAPTAITPNGCVEMATTHRHYMSDNGTRQLAGWWDWCMIVSGPDSLEHPKPDSASVEEDMTNSTWQNFYTYTSSIDGNKYFTTQTVHDDSQGYDCWNGLIYNYNFGYWETKLYSCYNGTTSNNHPSNLGWSQWEGKGEIEKECQNNYRGTRAVNVMVHSQVGGWEDINVVAPSFLDGTMCWDERSDWIMDYTDTGSGSTWHAKTPYSD